MSTVRSELSIVPEPHEDYGGSATARDGAELDGETQHFIARSAASGMAAFTSRCFGPYEVLHRLGAGGMADVYLAFLRREHGFGKVVVLKIPRSTEESNLQGLFLREARLASRFRHPNVVETLDAGQIDGQHYMVLEYLEGGTLTAVQRAVSDGAWPEFPGIGVLQDVLLGLDYLHTLQSEDGAPLRLVHQDIKPSNIFITIDGQVKILDFGITKSYATNATEDGVLRGTIQYLSPEAVVDGQSDYRGDLFSVGVILWEMLCGQKMWGDMSPTAILAKLSRFEIPPLPQDMGIHPELRAICEKALCGKDERFESAMEFYTALASVVPAMTIEDRRELGRRIDIAFEPRLSQARRAAADARGSSPGAEHYSGARGGTVVFDPRQERRRSPFVLVGLGAATMIVGAGVAVALARSGGSTPEPAASPSAVVAAAADPAVGESLPGSSSPSTIPSSPLLEPTVTVTISARPSTARLLLGGEPLESNPVVVTLPISSEKLVLSVDAPGYRSQTMQFAADRDKAIDVELSVLATDQAPAKPRKSTGKTKTKTKAKAKAKAKPEPDSSSAPASKPADGGRLSIERDNPFED
ncbi:MAG: serine/threonine-protein kinase [Myxococcota bacterium]